MLRIKSACCIRWYIFSLFLYRKRVQQLQQNVRRCKDDWNNITFVRITWTVKPSQVWRHLINLEIKLKKTLYLVKHLQKFTYHNISNKNANVCHNSKVNIQYFSLQWSFTWNVSPANWLIFSIVSNCLDICSHVSAAWLISRKKLKYRRWWYH